MHGESSGNINIVSSQYHSPQPVHHSHIIIIHVYFANLYHGYIMIVPTMISHYNNCVHDRCPHYMIRCLCYMIVVHAIIRRLCCMIIVHTMKAPMLHGHCPHYDKAPICYIIICIVYIMIRHLCCMIIVHTMIRHPLTHAT